MKAIIEGIQSNLANGVVWFNVKSNYLISINDHNLEDTVRIRIKTQGLGMKSNSHDLAIRWQTTHKLTKFAETKTRSNDNKIVEIFELRPFDTVIQPRLMNWSDLEVPRQWLIQDLVG